MKLRLRKKQAGYKSYHDQHDQNSCALCARCYRSSRCGKYVGIPSRLCRIVIGEVSTTGICKYYKIKEEA